MSKMFEVIDWPIMRRRGKALYRRLVEALEKEEPLTVIASLVNENPQVLEWTFQKGRTPLYHAACTYPLVSREVFQYLIDQYPKALAIAGDYGQYTPLHIACRVNNHTETILLLIDSWPKAAAITNRWQQYPLHCACENETPYYFHRYSMEVVVRRLLDVFPMAATMKDENDYTPLHHASWLSSCEEALAPIQLLMESFPQAAHMLDNEDATPLHRACHSYIWHGEPEKKQAVDKVVHYLARACPIACLLGESLPLDIAAEHRTSLDGRKWEMLDIQCLSQTTIDAAYGWIDSMFHPLISDVPRAVVCLVEQTLVPDTLATIKANGMTTNETIDLPTIKQLLKNEAVQTMLREESNMSVIRGFITMNAAGRKGAVQVGASQMRGLVVCASVSDNVGCLFAHLRENPSLCVRHEPI